jgi:hypothetical protein
MNEIKWTRTIRQTIRPQPIKCGLSAFLLTAMFLSSANFLAADATANPTAAVAETTTNTATLAVKPATPAATPAVKPAAPVPAVVKPAAPKPAVKKETAPQIIVDPIGTITLKLSRTDQNVIEMPNPIISKHYSQEKDIQVDTVGHRAIIKFLPSIKQKYEVVNNNQQTPVGEPEISYAKVKPADLVLITSDNAIYTFKVIPSDTVLKTVIIRSTAANLKDALKYETSSPYQESLSKLAKSVFRDETPNGYRVVEDGKRKWRIKGDDANMTITLLKTYKGALYDVHLLNIYNRDNTEKRFDGQLLFSIAEKIAPKNPARAVSFYYGNYAHTALPKSYVKALIIVEGGSNVK